ncbi:MAG: methyl-accepting chemotaxis protein [Alphaproteobacteria bacterium]|nr:MAG: methyl-accepting chemotaxis protein [Alphaproteobacteria bacterium]
MLPNILDFLSRRPADDRAALPVTEAPASVPEPADDQSQTRMAAIRETIDLIETDLAAMIRDVQRASDAVRTGTRTTAEVLGVIHKQSDSLAALSGNATENATHLAAATEQFAQSSGEIGRQVREAGILTDDAGHAAAAAGQSVDGLKASSAEIGNVVSLISAIAKQTNLLALNATIEAVRAGDAGRGFAVVASEVKALSSATQNATEEIGRKIDQLQRDAQVSIAAVNRIMTAIAAIRPVFAAIAGAIEEQITTTGELSRSAADSSRFVSSVAESASEIKAASARAEQSGAAIDRSGQDAANLAGKLQTRFVTFLRQTEIGDRRRHDRLPCDLTVALRQGGREVRGHTADLSEGGMLVRSDDGENLAVGAAVDADLSGIGRARARIVGRSSLGLHVEFTSLEGGAQNALHERLAAIRAENQGFVDRAVDTAAMISMALEEAVDAGKLTRETLFDTNYAPIEGSNPVQFRTPSLDLLERLLPEIQEPLLADDERMVFCAAVDRNGYLPVHNRIYSRPQRADDVAWNTANCRNRRIFDDRAGLSAARNVRPYLIQSYAREMGNGVVVMMREIDAPVRVFGKHWGGFRTAYKI